VRVTIYKDDDEAYELWRNAGMPENKIFRFDQDTNYWPAKRHRGRPEHCLRSLLRDLLRHSARTSRRHPTASGTISAGLEIWNNVFTQYWRNDGGILTPASPKKNIDTGMGLERTAAVLGDHPWSPSRRTSSRRPWARLQEIAGKKYTSTDDSLTDIAFRRIADHIRATTFLIGDGVIAFEHGAGLRTSSTNAPRDAGGSTRSWASRKAVSWRKPSRRSSTSIRTSYPEVWGEARRRSCGTRQTRKSSSARPSPPAPRGLRACLSTLKTGDGRPPAKDVFDLATTFGFPVEDDRRSRPLSVALASTWRSTTNC